VAAHIKPKRAPSGQVRIIGGQWRRSVITFSDAQDLRPTPDRVRETLFNWLGQNLSGLRILDAFSGTGVLALEAASRGAAQVVALETNAHAAQAITAHAERLGGTQIKVLRADALAWLSGTTERFDVIFLDPPFSKDYYARLSEVAPLVLTDNGVVYVEAPNPVTEFGALVLRKSMRAGAVHAHLFGHGS
jgi:16S rRNA (guanine966-N2)-methyltransferase